MFSWVHDPRTSNGEDPQGLARTWEQICSDRTAVPSAIDRHGDLVCCVNRPSQHVSLCMHNLRRIHKQRHTPRLIFHTRRCLRPACRKLCKKKKKKVSRMNESRWHDRHRAIVTSWHSLSIPIWLPLISCWRATDLADSTTFLRFHRNLVKLLLNANATVSQIKFRGPEKRTGEDKDERKEIRGLDEIKIIWGGWVM